MNDDHDCGEFGEAFCPNKNFSVTTVYLVSSPDTHRPVLKGESKMSEEEKIGFKAILKSKMNIPETAPKEFVETVLDYAWASFELGYEYGLTKKAA